MSCLRLSAFIVILVLWIHPFPSDAQVVLNEIQASNTTTIADEDGDFEDWIELYNTSTSDTISLSGFGLSDDYEQPYRWVFPEGTIITPGGHLLVWASGKDRRNSAFPLHTNFSIAQVGEEILLTHPGTDERVDEIPPTEIPTDFSYGRMPDGAPTWAFFSNPTPGSTNDTTGYTDILNRVEFSVPGGFHTGPVTLELTSSDNDVEIRYTLDGSEPTEYSVLYIEPIYIEDRTDQPNGLSTIMEISHNYSNAAPPAENVFKGTVVRAAAFRPGAVTSPVETNTYFITEYGTGRYTLPVISISTHRDSLFDYERGIYVLGKIWDDAGGDNHTIHAPANYTQRGADWERRMHMEFFEPDGTSGFSQEMGVRMHGGASRAFPQKSLRLYSRSEYGAGRFRYRVFPDSDLDDFNRLVLRNSGQDVVMTMFRDAYIQRAVNHMRFATMASRPVIVFINGEYWGIYNIRERYDRNYLETHYRVEGDRIDYLTGNSIVTEGSNSHYTDLLRYLENNDMQLAHHYEHVKTMMDIENFIDYYIAQIYIRNNDWPHNNIDYWRYRTDYNPYPIIPEHDGRWRWMLFDTEFGFGWQPDGAGWPSTPQNDWHGERHFDRQSYIRNMMNHVTVSEGSRAWSTFLFRSLIQNPEFRNSFMNRFADMLNTAFRSERMTAVLDSMKTVYAPEIQEHLDRWSVTEPENWNFYWRPRITYEEWEGEVGVMDEFARKRPAYQWRHLMEFDGRDTMRITLNSTDPHGGYLRVNSIDITPETIGIPGEPYPWTGTYFTDIPVTIRAVARPGYRFIGWENLPDHEKTTVIITTKSDTSITAIFEADARHDPPAHRLSDGPYTFNYWPANADAGTYPDNMNFMYMDRDDPGLDAIAVDKTTGRYDLDSRTRINGLGGEGFAFMNTSNEEGNPGYPGRRLGSAFLGLDTRGYSGIRVGWTGGTIAPNSRIYHIRLEYRVNTETDFRPVLDEHNDPVEYTPNHEAGHYEQIGPVILPEESDDQPYVQLRWRYYFTGNQIDDDDGSRSQLRVSNIEVTGSPITSVTENLTSEAPTYYSLEQNYPNPFNNTTVVSYRLPERASVRLEIYSILGQIVQRYEQGEQQPGIHTVHIDAGTWPSGVYIARLRVAGESGQTMELQPIRMMLLR
jgi:hypothetical protein